MPASDKIDLMQDARLKRFLHVLRLLSEIYALVVTFFILLLLLPGRPVVLEALSNLLNWALLPSFAVLIIAGIFKKWRTVAIWAFPFISFMYLYGELFLPGFNRNYPVNTTSQSVCLSVMTCNMTGKSDTGEGSQIDILRDSGADIIAIQEVTERCGNAVERNLSDIYPYMVIQAEGLKGIGLLSKYPVIQQDIFKTSEDSLYHALAVIRVNGVDITVISTHIVPPVYRPGVNYTDLQREDMAGLLAKVPKYGPVIMMGDLNMCDHAPEYRMVRKAGLIDTHREIGWGLGNTWPTTIVPYARWWRQTLIRLDYIWHSYDIRAIKIWQGPRGATDHLPVLAEFEIRQ